jgi:hypothetical protein
MNTYLDVKVTSNLQKSIKIMVISARFGAQKLKL